MNQASRVVTLDDGSRHMDPMDMLAAWCEREGVTDEDWEDPSEVVRRYAQDVDGAIATGVLFDDFGAGWEGVTA